MERRRSDGGSGGEKYMCRVKEVGEREAGGWNGRDGSMCVCVGGGGGGGGGDGGRGTEQV